MIRNRMPRRGRGLTLRAAAVAALLVLTSVMPAAAAPVPLADAVVELTGSLADVHPDTFGGTVRHETHLVLDDGRSVVLQLPETTDHPALGSRASVRGSLRGGQLVVAAGGLRYLPAADGRNDGGSTAGGGGGATTTSTDPVVAAASVTKKVAVLLINFTDDLREPFTATAAATNFFATAPTKSVRTFFSEQSYGAWETTGDVFGYYTITADRTACNWSDWGAKARAAAAAAKVDLSLYTNVVHVWPNQSACSWSGLGYLPGTYTFLDGTISVYVATHELGHNYGAHHASTMSCTADGVRVSISTSCSLSEYGDPFDTMGNALNLSHTWHRKQMGQLTTSDQQTVTSGGRYTVGVAGSSTPGGPRIVRIPRGSDGTYFYLEFRQPGALFDAWATTAPVVNGVSIRLAPDTSRVQSKLIDATPETTSFSDAPLPVGRTFSDPISNLSITVVSAGPAGAVVDVAWGLDTAAPTAVSGLAAAVQPAGSVALSWSAATDNVGVTGYEILRDGSSVTTVATTSWTDTGVSAGATHTWTVRARDAAGNVGPGQSVSAFVPVADTTPPTAPSNLTLTTLAKNQVRLSWTASSDNLGVAGYRLYDGSKLIATVSGTTTSHTYKLPRGSHTWTVRAFDAAGNVSAASNSVTYSTR